jgi:hypothetical protein
LEPGQYFASARTMGVGLGAELPNHFDHVNMVQNFGRVSIQSNQ